MEKGRYRRTYAAAFLAVLFTAQGLSVPAATAETGAPPNHVKHGKMPPVLPREDDVVAWPAPPSDDSLDPITAPIDENTSKTSVDGEGEQVSLRSETRAPKGTRAAARTESTTGLSDALSIIQQAIGSFLGTSSAPSEAYGVRVACSGTGKPEAPVLASPNNNSFLEASTPVLKLAGLPCDPEGDAVVVNYHVSKSGGSQVWSSGWTTDLSLPVADGNVFDGQQYTWYAESADVCALNPLQLCSHAGGWNAPSPWTFTISQRHLGNDQRYIMWKQKIGNNMRLRVNQANGNVLLKVPVGSVNTVAGRMRWGLSYNSQSEADRGLGAGWRLFAGSDSGGGMIPVELKDMADSSDTYKMIFESGSPSYFTKVSGQLYLDGSGGMLRKNTNGTFTFSSAIGDTYTFNADLDLQNSRNKVSKDIQSTRTGTDFVYEFNNGHHLTQIDGPTQGQEGQHVYFTWTDASATGKLQTISDTTGSGGSGRTWTVDYTGQSISSIRITDSATNASPLKEAFGYKTFGSGGNSRTLVNSVQNGKQIAAGTGYGWSLDYNLDTAVPNPLWRVSKIAPPARLLTSGGQYWYLNYTNFSAQNSNLGPSSTVYSAELTDPRGTTNNNPPFSGSTWTTKTYFNYAGLPVQQDGPVIKKMDASTNYVPQRTWLWDTNGNARCERDAVANQIAKGCFVRTNGTNNLDNDGDGLSTIYTHSATVPYPLTRVVYPKPKVNSSGVGTGSAKQIDYSYDSTDDFDGLWGEQFSSRYATGVPDYEGVWSAFNYNNHPDNITNRTNGYSIRWTGTINIPAQDRYYFKFITNGDGVMLSVDGTNLFNCFTGNSTGFNCDGTNASTLLAPGDRQIMIAISHPNASDMNFNLQWNRGNPNSFNTINAHSDGTDPNLAIQTKAIIKADDQAAGEPKLEHVTNYVKAAGGGVDVALSTRLPWSESDKDLITGEVRTITYDYYNDSGLLKTKTLDASSSAKGGGFQPRFEYDYAYRDSNNHDNPACPAKVTQKDALNPTGPALVTTNTCDQIGNVLTTSVHVPAVSDTGGNIQNDYYQKTFFTYGALGNKLSESLPVVSSTDPSSPTTDTVTTYAYNADLSMKQQNVPLGSGSFATTDYTYTDQGWLLRETLPAGGPNEPLWSTTRPTVDYTYDNVGNLLTKVDQLSKTWTYAYDSLNRQVTLTDPTLVKTNTYYLLKEPSTNDWGATTVQMGSNGVASATRDKMTGEVGSVATYQAVSGTYWTIPAGTAPSQGPIKSGYDVMGNKTSITVPGISPTSAEITETMFFNAFGEMTEDDRPVPPGPNGQVLCSGSPTCVNYTVAATKYNYNELGQLYRVTGPRTTSDNVDPLASGTQERSSYTYDQWGNMASVKQEGINSTANPSTFTFLSDAVGNRIQAQSPLACNPDANGNCQSAYASAKWETRTWTYGPAGSVGTCAGTAANTAGLLSCSSVGAKKTTYSYAGSWNKMIGKPASVLDPRGITTTFAYDNYGNQTSSSPSGGTSAITTQFDQLGNLKNTTSGTKSTVLTYDDAGRTKTTTSDGNLTTYYYDASSTGTGLLTSVVDPAGTSSFEYDTANRLWKVQDPFATSGQKVKYTYDFAGRLTKREDPTGSGSSTTWIRCYDAASGMIKGQYVTNPATGSCSQVPTSNLLQSSVYGYDIAGNVVSDAEFVKDTGLSGSTVHNGTWAYTYDGADRLATANPPSGAGALTTYTYDGSGNRVQVAISGGATSTTSYDGRGLPATYTSAGTTTDYCYDDAGGLTGMGVPHGTACTAAPAGTTKKFTNDGFGRMITSQTGSATAVNYTYDALSRLATSSASGSTPAAGYVYQGTGVSLVKETVSNTLFASSPFGPLAQKSGSVTAYFLKDLHGDVVGLSQAGATSNLAATTFDPWGEVKGLAGTATSLGFQGQITDKATGMTKTATRFYDPSMGRFTAQDVLFGDVTDGNSLNQYAYAQGSPVNLSDPSGLSPKDYCQENPRECHAIDDGYDPDSNETVREFLQGSEGTGTDTQLTGGSSQVTQEELGSVEAPGGFDWLLDPLGALFDPLLSPDGDYCESPRGLVDPECGPRNRAKAITDGLWREVKRLPGRLVTLVEGIPPGFDTSIQMIKACAQGGGGAWSYLCGIPGVAISVIGAYGKLVLYGPELVEGAYGQIRDLPDPLQQFYREHAMFP